MVLFFSFADLPNFEEFKSTSSKRLLKSSWLAVPIDELLI